MAHGDPATTPSRSAARGAAGEHLALKRVYAPPASEDGCRVLVDRLWPRGLSKQAAALDQWIKELAPSDALRSWFGHQPRRWTAFKRRYSAELAERPETLDALRQLRALRKAHGTVTLLYGAKDERHNNAVVLREYLERATG